VYIFEFLLYQRTEQENPRGFVPHMAGWRIRIGLLNSQAAFITKQARIDIAVASVAIIALLLLAFYLIRTSKRFVALKAREESERNLASLGRMAATLAHEIRNPLGAMKGLTQVIQEETPKDHKSYSMIGTVISEAERLEQLVSDLLTFSRPHTAQITDIDLKRLLDDVISMAQASRADSEVVIRTSLPESSITLKSDENGLKQVLLNVLLNAIEASPKGGTVSVAASTDIKRKQVSILIEDHGEGIGDRNPDELFQPFTTTKVKGSGLGLSVSKQILDRLGGEITLTNAVDGGARCRIDLPMNESS
jgi:two-component system sensor histidine kinase HydH